MGKVGGESEEESLTIEAVWENDGSNTCVRWTQALANPIAQAERIPRTEQVVRILLGRLRFGLSGMDSRTNP